ncbi:AcrB/AcrD/AcrF family protein [Marinomonas mediterranea]|uniref:efflux RND transporter permease subunit n=1 Tax=Marinomonas mediterranea TaxID=119864 RepID=UPI00234B8A09|nr:efflux RND transporter permease subunit [Marinomonas mediterranea]WCN15249.1 AcrB/AcrD/AcrF family protein [Marinomonas mediterranea]
MIRYFINHPTAANIIMLICIALGVVTLPQIKRETLPEINAYTVDVKVPYPGATSETVVQKVCLTLENALDGISFMEEKHCKAQQNVGVMSVKMLEQGDFKQFTDDVRDAVNTIDNFPDEVDQWTISQRGRTQNVVAVAISADMDRVALKQLAEQVKRKLLIHPDIPLVDINDFSTHQLRVSTSLETMRQYGFSLDTLGQRVAQQNIELPLGTLQTEQQDIQILLKDERRSIETLADVPVLSGEQENDVLLRQIADIRDTFDLEEKQIRFNGKPTALLQVSKNSVEDSLTVLNAVEDVLDELRKTLPESVSLTLTSDNTSIVKDRINLLIDNAWQGLLLVFVVMWVFFSFRLAFWVVMGLPVSFLASFFVMQYLGLSINMLSMVALLLALGILMDDSIVIVESVSHMLNQGLEYREAVYKGVMMVFPGVLSSFLTTLCIFIGLVFIEGNLGQILKVIPIVLISVLTVSLIEAFFILPHHLAHSLKKSENRQTSRFHTWFDTKFTALNDLSHRIIIRLVRVRYMVLGLVVASFIFSVSMLASGILQFSAFPDIDGDVLQARLLMPSGTPFAHTRDAVARIESALEETNLLLSTDESSDLVKSVTVTYGENPDYSDEGANLAMISVDLLGAELRNTSIQRFADTWRKQVGDLPHMLTLTFKEPQLGPQGRAIDIRLYGDDSELLASAARDLKHWLAGYPGVQNILDDMRPGKVEYSLSLKQGATALGISSGMIANQLRAAFQGSTMLETYRGLEDLDITVELSDESKNDFSDFDNFPIIHPETNKAIPLSALVDIEQTRGLAVINRINNQKTVSVFADVDATHNTAKAVIGELNHTWLDQFSERYPTLTYTIEGEVKNATITQTSMKRAFILGMIGVFFLLSFQFHSYVEPIIVLVAIPFTLIGVIWGHFLMGINFSMPSLMGFISLAGIVVNDSILLVQFVKSHVKKGMAVHDAAAKASYERFRAVLLTSITTIAGMTPLLFETSLQAQIIIPLATSIVFGITASTILVLFVLPCIYSILEDLGVAKPEAGHVESGHSDSHIKAGQTGIS